MAGILAFGAELKPALAANDAMAFLYDNTLAAQGGPHDLWLSYDWYYPSGIVREFQILRRRDGLIALHGFEGHYEATSAQGIVTICQQFDSAHRLCQSIQQHRPGDVWHSQFGNGAAENFRLLPGRFLLNFMIGSGIDPHVLERFQYPDYPPKHQMLRMPITGAASQ